MDKKLLSGSLLFVIILAGIFFFLLSEIQKEAGGSFVYVIDDPYIHLTLAKNIAQNQSFGMYGGQFASASSSPLWTLFLSVCYNFFPEFVLVPAILNFTFSLLLTLLVYIFLAKKGTGHILSLAFALLIYLAAPCPALIYTGMEHVLHILLVAMIFLMLTAEKYKSRVDILFLCLLSLAATGIRYETAFLVFFLSIFLAYNKNILAGALVLISGAAVPVIFGLYSLSKGWFFFPLSIYLKADLQSFSIIYFIKKFILQWYIQLSENPSLLIILLVISIILYGTFKNDLIPRHHKGILLIYLFSSILHLQFASTGWFYRYEAYLITSGLLLIFLNYKPLLNLNFNFLKNLKKTGALLLILAIFLAPFIHRAGSSLIRIPKAANKIFAFDYSAARFLSKYFPGKVAAINDIGAISYYNSAQYIDLVGLSSLDVAELKRNGNFNTKSIGELLNRKDCELAIIYPNWFVDSNRLPGNFRKVAEWNYLGDYAVAEGTLAFYTSDEKLADSLVSAMIDYERKIADIIKLDIK
ncbi:MAG: hypothetical protein ACLFR2_06985 [Candidatus Kapaibacterium sp.]